MPILYLSKYELVTLSSCSRIKPNELSPMTRLYAENTLDFNSEKLQEALKEFLNSNYIMNFEGRNLLAKELEPAFFVLHAPEKALVFKKLSFGDINETYFSIKNGVAVQYINRYDGLFETLVYPYQAKAIPDWVEQELFKDIAFSPDQITSFNADLTADETVLLFVIINTYRNRIISSREALSPDKTWITLREIRDFENFDDLKGLITVFFNSEDIKTYLKNNGNLPLVVESLINKGLIVRGQGGLSYSDISKEIFDPGNVIDSIIAKEVTNKTQRISSLNILKNGYMLFSQASNNLDYKIKTFPSVIEIKKLVEEMVSVEEPVKDRSKFCKNCGNKLREGATFCNSCGNKI